jgi:hypothetical protein
MLVSKMRVGGFDLRSSQNKDNKIDICCFMAEHGALTSKSKHCLARRQDNVSVRMGQHIYPYTHYTNPAKRVGLV